MIVAIFKKSSLWMTWMMVLRLSQHAVTKVNALSSMSTSKTSGAKPSVVAAPIVSNKEVAKLNGGMDYVKLGSSDLLVSKVCMGTMTFGKQNTLQEGVEQLNAAFDEYGINFLDTAELYPVPSGAETKGKTDETVAAFLKGRKREDVIVATKVAGRSERLIWLRKDGSAGTMVNRDQIKESVDASLKRLGTDYIDLIQIHWPDRYVGGMFGSPDFSPSRIWDSTPFQEQLSALKKLQDEGKVRYVGVSNETPYGVCSMVELAKRDPDQYAKIVSIQNSYSLVVRKDFEAGLSESCYMHNVGLMAYSPLSAGVLTGKYQNPDKVPMNARLRLFPGFMDRYIGSQNNMAVNEYCKIAKEAGLTPTQLALSWCFHREHVTSTIIGATNLSQLRENIESYDIILSREVMDRIAKVYHQFTDPTKTPN